MNFIGKLVSGLLAFVFAGIVISSCHKSTPSSPSSGPNTITTVLQTANDATLFAASMAKCGLDTTFNGTGPFTVFVPTDNAFLTSGVSGTTLNNLSVDSLRKFLLYHTIAANLPSASLPAGPNAKLITASGDSVFVTTTASGVFVNGVPTLATDIMASNGVINAMSAPLFPPVGNIMQTIQIDTSFSYLVAAIVRASQGTHDLNTMLTSGGPYTLFAPVNYAFRSAGFATTDDIINASPDSIANIVMYNMLDGRTFTSDVTIGQTKTTLNDSTILFTASGSTKQVTGKGNDIPASVLATNVMARNGVIHVIDKVLLP